MRNLAQYPITLDEMIQAVESAASKYEIEMSKRKTGKAPVGDIHGVALNEAANRLKRLQFAAADK